VLRCTRIIGFTVDRVETYVYLLTDTYNILHVWTLCMRCGRSIFVDLSSSSLITPTLWRSPRKSIGENRRNGIFAWYPVYMIKANIEQSSSKHPANAFKIHVHYVYSNCSTFASCLLDVCLMMAWSCKRGITQLVPAELWAKKAGGPERWTFPTNSCKLLTEKRDYALRSQINI